MHYTTHLFVLCLAPLLAPFHSSFKEALEFLRLLQRNQRIGGIVIEKVRYEHNGEVLRRHLVDLLVAGDVDTEVEQPEENRQCGLLLK